MEHALTFEIAPEEKARAFRKIAGIVAEALAAKPLPDQGIGDAPHGTCPGRGILVGAEDAQRGNQGGLVPAGC